MDVCSNGVPNCLSRRRVSPGTAAATPPFAHTRASPSPRNRREEGRSVRTLRSSSISSFNCFSTLSLSSFVHHSIWHLASRRRYPASGTLGSGRNNSLSHTAILDIFNTQLNTHNMDVVTRIPELAKQFRVRFVFRQVYSCMF